MLTLDARSHAHRAGRRNVYGRTDRGNEGMLTFLKSHRCGELCHALNRRWGSRAPATEAELDQDEAGR
jgi:hypothetical protein